MDKTELIIWTKQKEIEMLGKTSKEYAYFSGKAQAFSEVWEYLVFDGKEPHPKQYNQENDYWSKVANGILK